MATIRAAKAPIEIIQRNEPRRGRRKAWNVLAFADLFGGAVAVSIGLAEAVFFCAYLVAVPFLVLIALIKIPLWLRDYFAVGDEESRG